jgi:FdrA protein
MTTLSLVMPGHYVDSVLLMRLAQRLEALDGVQQAAAMMGTDANKETLDQGGFLTPESARARADDLVVSVKAYDREIAAAALARVDELLSQHADGSAGATDVRSLDAALHVDPKINLVLISTPGEYAAAEAHHALERGLHVLIFSSNVSMEDEISLKRLARDSHLLCMGPDCGTALIGGVGLAFANAVRRGPIGIVAASGTGAQAVSSLLDRFGVGVSHIIGCGSRDLSLPVGAMTARAGLAALEADEHTKAIILLSKPPHPSVAADLVKLAHDSSKPVIACFLGDDDGPQTLPQAALAAAAAIGVSATISDLGPSPVPPGQLPAEQGYIRGLFAGGTLAYEAQLVLLSLGLEVFSNAPVPGGRELKDVHVSRGHTVLDLGTEELTRGRPHPMIDSRLRRERLLQEADDPEVGVILLDVVLGFGSAEDPAGDLIPAIAQAMERRRRNGTPLHLIASIVGTSADRQNLDDQVTKLRSAGVTIARTNDEAASLAVGCLPQSQRSRMAVHV